MMLERWTGIALAAIAACTAFAISQVDKLPMLDERVIFLVEVALAVGIGLFVFQYSRHNDRLIKGHLDGVEVLLKRNEKAKRVRRIRASRALYSSMQDMADVCSKLVEAGDRLDSTHALQWESFKSQVGGMHSQIDEYLDKLGRHLESSDHLDSSTYDKILDMVNLWDAKIHIKYDEKVFDTGQYHAMLDMINRILPRLERHLELGDGVSTAPFRPTDAISRSNLLAVTLDRNTYPPGATIHASLTATGKLPGRKVTVTVLDANLKVLVRKTATAPGYPEGPIALLRSRLGSRNSGKTSGETGSGGGGALVMDMKPKGAATGGQYMVRAACGGLITEASFAIEPTLPEVRTNKSEFLMGEDIIVTVIDPAANKDGLKRNFAGASGQSRLVIDSPHGRINGYRLEETGDSTGVFQGRVRIIGVRNDGSVRGTEIDGVHIDKSQGKGDGDGAIVCGPGQPVHIQYINKLGSGATTVLGIGVNPDVDLGRKEYACLDRVDICVSAPYIAGDGGAPPAIGDDRQDCWVSISSAEGSIEGYRLVESEPNSGIFTGTVSLTGFAAMGIGRSSPKEMQYGETGGAGPHGGRLACRADDAVTVRVTSAFAEPVSASARIRLRAGTPGVDVPPSGQRGS